MKSWTCSKIPPHYITKKPNLIKTIGKLLNKGNVSEHQREGHHLWNSNHVFIYLHHWDWKNKMEILNVISVFLILLYLRDAPGEMKVTGSHGNALRKIPRAPEGVYMEEATIAKAATSIQDTEWTTPGDLKKCMSSILLSISQNGKKPWELCYCS